MSDEQSLTDVVHNSGPYSAVNRVSARGKQPYLKPETMRALWSPVIKMNSPESLNQVNPVLKVLSSSFGSQDVIKTVENSNLTLLNVLFNHPETQTYTIQLPWHLIKFCKSLNQNQSFVFQNEVIK